MRNILILLVATFFTNLDFAKADFVIGFNPTNTLNSANVFVGDSFAVNLYLIESNTTKLTTFGLLGFGSRATYNSTVIQATGATNDANFPIVGGSPDLSVSGQIDLFGGATTPPKLSSIHLATLNFSAAAAGTTVISFGDYDPLISDFTLNDTPAFTDLDPSLFSPSLAFKFDFTVNVAAVPEPSSLLGCSTLGLTFVMWRRRSRTKAKVSPKNGLQHPLKSLALPKNLWFKVSPKRKNNPTEVDSVNVNDGFAQHSMLKLDSKLRRTR
ncbi:MAG: PEP-CTERM sorting domain-containing protein [Pirellulaceae bacterium]|nr:PEP-CTERM sorting domain-containing protein [Pirellulaceae bacterium]